MSKKYVTLMESNFNFYPQLRSLSYPVADVEISAGDERGVGRLFWLTTRGRS